MLSDFISEPYEKALQHAARKHDLVGIQVYDQHDRDLPDMGLIQVIDAETKGMRWLDTGDRSVREQYTAAFEGHKQYCVQSFRKSGASLMRARTNEDYVKVLQGFFKGR